MAASQFCCAMRESYPKVSELAFGISLPFATTYFCESGFSVLVHIKMKALNRKKFEEDMRLALSNSTTRTSKLALQLQSQPSQ